MLRLAKRNAQLWQQLRGYASQVAVAEESAFLRYASPFPAKLDLAPALAQLPETKVRARVGVWHELTLGGKVIKSRRPGARPRGPFARIGRHAHAPACPRFHR